MVFASQTVKRDATTLLYAYVLVASTRSSFSLLASLSKGQQGKFKGEPRSNVWHDPKTFSISSFPVVLRRVFDFARARYPDSIGIPAFLASPSILLIPSRLRIQLVLYIATSALSTAKKPHALERVMPPVWTLNVVGNAILIMLFLTSDIQAQAAYEGIILRYSSGYVPRGKTKQDICTLLNETDYPTITREQARNMKAHPLHTRLVCASLHPETPSCLENYITSMIRESLKVCKWIGAVGALSLLYKRRFTIFSTLIPTFREWLTFTATSTIFISGSINTSWVFICLLQRVLPGTVAPRIRILLNGAFASLWILILPSNRRKAISIYVARFVALSVYQALKSRTGLGIPYGEVLIFAMGLSSLIKSHQSGSRTDGLSSLLIKGIGM